jgi:Leucine-rich repeat (LRR) protein
VPAALGQLAALKVLWLDNNQLTGAVPAALGQLAALEVLWLNNNRPTSFPAALMQQLRGRGVRVRLDEGVALLG